MRELGEWLRSAEGGLFVLIGDVKARERIAAATGESGVDVAGLDVAGCVAGLAGGFGARAERVGELVDLLAGRDGGDVTLVLHGLDRAADPEGVAGTVARRLAAEPGVRVVVGLTRDDAGLRALLGPAETSDRTLWTRRWANRRDPAAVTRLTGHRAYIHALTALALPSGRILLASGCDDGVIRLWDPVAAEQFGAAIHAHEDGVTALAAVPWHDGRTVLASGGNDWIVRLWDPLTGKRLEPEFVQGCGISALAVVHTADGMRIAVSGAEPRLWNPADPVDVRPLGPAEGLMTSFGVVTAGDRAWLAAGVYDGPASTWDLGTGEHRSLPEGSKGKLVAVGGLLATAGPEGRARLWDPVSGEHLRDTAESHEGWRKAVGEITAMAAVPHADGRMLLATAGDDDGVRLWDPATGAAEGGTVVDGKGITYAMAPLTLPDGRVLLALSTGQDVWLWDTAAAGPLGHGQPVWSVAVDGEGVLTSTDLYTAKRWDAATGEPRGRFTPESIDRMQRAYTLADGRGVVVDHDHTSRVWDPASGERLAVVDAPFVRAVRMPGGADRLVSAASYLNPAVDNDPPLRFWDPVTGAETGAINWPGGRIRLVTAITRPGGNLWLACRTDDNALLLFDAVSGEEVGAVLPGAEEHRLLLVLSDGLILSGDEDGVLSRWDPETGEERAGALPGGGASVVAAAEIAAAEGIWLATADERGVSLWVLGEHGAARVDEIDPGGKVHTLTTLPDGGLAVGTDNGLTVLDVHTDRPWHPLPETTPTVAASEPEPARTPAPDPGTGTWTIAWEARGTRLRHPAPTADGRLLAVDDDDAIHVFAADGTPLREPFGEQAGPVTALAAVDLNGTVVAASYGVDGVTEDEEYERRVLLLWDLGTGERVGEIADPDFSEYGVDVGALAASTGGDVLVGIRGNEWGSGASAWSPRTGEELHAFGIQSVSDVYVQDLAPVEIDGRASVVAVFSDFDQDDEDQVLVGAFDLASGDAVGTPWHLAGDQSYPFIAATVLDGHAVLAAWAPGDRVRVRRIVDGAPVAALDVADVGPAERLAAGTVAGTPVLAAAHAEGAVTVWDLAARRRIVTARAGEVANLVFTPDGLLVLAGPDGLTAVRVA